MTSAPKTRPGKQGQSETDEPWARPGQSSQGERPPPRDERRQRENKDNETA